MSAVGGRGGRPESDEGEEGQKARLLDAGRQLLGGATLALIWEKREPDSVHCCVLR